MTTLSGVTLQEFCDMLILRTAFLIQENATLRSRLAELEEDEE